MKEHNEASPTTESERYLARLCRKSFLRMWSWPNVYRDQSCKATAGKEVCDLLVVFDQHIFIFSDKECQFLDTGRLELDWSRWFKKAVLKSAHQVWGAERWIRQFPNRLFSDHECKKPFPFGLPPNDEAIFHRIVVAHGSADRCRSVYGGSGSLMIRPELVDEDHYDFSRAGFRPFAIGRLSTSKGFIHVIDDFSLDVLLRTVDTASDLALYLQRRAAFIESGHLLAAAGEEDLLAYYLRHADSKGQHCFEVPAQATQILIGEGSWESFRRHPERLAQIEADKVSYSWDALIEQFSKHILDDTLYYHSEPEGSHQERGIRFLAREGRVRRRMLARFLLGVLEKGVNHDRATRVVLPSSKGDPHYVFLSLKHQFDSYEQYRTIRSNLLERCCLVTRLKFPNARHIVGIATEPLSANADRSEDLIYFDGDSWNEDLAREAEEIQNKMGLLTNTQAFSTTEPEYPLQRDLQLRKGRNRNRTCPCGSGSKYKNVTENRFNSGANLVPKNHDQSQCTRSKG